MKSLFKWCPLSPPSSYHASTRSTATGASIFAALSAIIIMLFGLEQGLFLYLPLALSSFLFGLPHGAIDHLIIVGLARREMNLRTLTLACGVYLSLVILFFSLWWLNPMVGLILFLGITVYHWGKADLAFESLIRTEALQNTPQFLKLSHLLLRGFLPIGTPFLAFPEATESFIISCTSSFGQTFALNTSVSTVISICLGILLISEAFYLKSVGQHRTELATEDIGLLVFFFLVPPLLAIGLYFCLWHSFRHVLRLVHYQPDRENNQLLLSRLGRFYRQALPFTLASIMIVLAAVILLPEVKHADQLFGTYLVVISSLTLPHLCVVEWMDKRERI
ncbi:MAG: Brp/Blh family beta-carotene 15,15'-dioxygenase [Lentimonas sp.]